MGNKIFYGFLILLFSALLWLIPISSLIYDFRTDVTEDEFYIATEVGSTNTTVTLSDFIYDNDTSTIDVISDLNTDSPTFVSYNTTTRATLFNGLTDNATRNLDITYDTDALDSGAWGTILTIFPKLWMIIIILFPVAGLVAILFGRS
jgi:hypothetical protein